MELNRQFGVGRNVTEYLNVKEASSQTNETLTDNITSEYTPFSYHPVTLIIEQYAIPVICLLGLISNTLSSVVFLQKSLRNNSCSIFLAVRGFSDNGFLSTLLVIWVSRTFRLQVGSLNGSCNTIIFLSYFCGFISVWCVVFVTLENYIRICRPFVVHRICTTFTAKLIVGVLCFISVGFYNFTFWAMDKGDCMPFPNYYNTVQAFIYVDSLITLVIPLFLITYLMTTIVFDLVKSFSIRSRRRRRVSKRNVNPLAKVTKMLFAVTVTFFFFNLPSHVYRLSVMISSFLDKNDAKKTVTTEEELLHQITLLMSYLSLSINIIVYLIFGSKFKCVLMQLCHIPGKHNVPFIEVNIEGCTTNGFTNITKSLSTIIVASESNVYEIVPLREMYSS